MWAWAASVVLGIIALATAAVTPPASVETISEAVASNQEAIAQLSENIAKMVSADGEIKQRLTEAINVLIDSQNALQRFFSGSESGKDVGKGQGGEDIMRQFANQIVTTLRGVSFRDAGNMNKSYAVTGKPANNTVLVDILTELKELNTHFQRHLTSLSCPPPFVMLGDECFNVILEDMSWADARNRCLTIGADLAQPTNITRLKLYVGTKYPRKGRRNFWIGGVYREKVWQWLSGDPLEEGYWHTNEPSGNGECLGLFDGWENPFTDFPCENERRSICKRTLFE